MPHYLRLVTIIVVSSACASGCRATVGGAYSQQSAQSQRVANLELALNYPWLDNGQCVVASASKTWREIANRCNAYLDRSRLADPTGKCHRVALAGADPEEIEAMVGICLLAPELLAAGLIIGVTVIAATAIVEELEAEPAQSREWPPDTNPDRPKGSCEDLRLLCINNGGTSAYYCDQCARICEFNNGLWPWTKEDFNGVRVCEFLY